MHILRKGDTVRVAGQPGLFFVVEIYRNIRTADLKPIHSGPELTGVPITKIEIHETEWGDEFGRG